MGQSFGHTVKAVAPEWLIDKVKRDVQFVKRNFGLVKDVALIDFNSFKEVVADMNSIMKTCCVEANEQVVFGLRTVDDDLFWKAYAKVICLKVDKQERTFSIMRCMNIRQFWLLREGILRELQNRNAVLEGAEEFIFITQEDYNDEPVASVQEEKMMDICHPLTVSTVISKVDEYGVVDIDECLICLDNNVDISLPCAHSFCSRCINQWVAESKSCPTCRDEIKAPQELWQFTEIPNIAQINRQLIDLATGT